MRSLTDHVDTNLVFRRVPARMFAVLGPLLVVLAAIGIYAVVAYTVAQRTTEIGVRMALGATAARVLRDLVGESLRVILVGASLGWLVAFVLVIDLLERERVDWVVFAGVPALLLAVATAACWLPARRATRIDPPQHSDRNRHRHAPARRGTSLQEQPASSFNDHRRGSRTTRVRPVSKTTEHGDARC